MAASAPIAAPPPRTFAAIMHQRWSDLLFMHWDFEPGFVQDYLPAGLRVECHTDRAWIGVVPFCMSGVRLSGLPPIPGIDQTLELNLRTYVRAPSGETGVYFFSLEANHALMVAVARRTFHLNYRRARMVMERLSAEELAFRSRRPGGDSPEVRIRYRRAQSGAAPALAGSLDAFLINRTRLFSVRQRDGAIFQGEVHHAPYQLMAAQVEQDGRELFAVNGLPVPDRPPRHVAATLPVKVVAGRVRKIS